jgi:hypothetical protein
MLSTQYAQIINGTLLFFTGEDDIARFDSRDTSILQILFNVLATNAKFFLKSRTNSAYSQTMLNFILCFINIP